MKKASYLFFLLFISFTAFSQSPFHLGFFGGIASYQGDLVSRNFQQPKPAFGVTANYEVSDRFMLRGGFTLARVAGADAKGKSEFLKEIRNLSFETNISEASLIGELTVFNLYNIRWSPYFFAGVAVYHFDPYTYDSTNKKYYLQPLSTEGQGISAYPDRKPYKLTQLAIPLGGGIKFAITDDIRLGFEIGTRKLFTDYLDDVSTDFVDPNILLAERGPKAVELSYRGDEVPGEYATANGGVIYPDNGYPAKGVQRGNPKFKDYYYFTGIHLTFRIGNGGGSSGRGRNLKMYGCPANPL